MNVRTIAGCSICSGGLDGSPLCRSCTAMDRAFDARPAIPFNLHWGLMQDCPPEAKRVLIALLHKTDFETGFTQIDLLTLAGEVDRQQRIEQYGHWAEEEHTSPEVLQRRDHHVARRMCAQLRELVRLDLLETLPKLPDDLPWLLRYLSVKSRTPEGIIWMRIKGRDQARVWDTLAA